MYNRVVKQKGYKYWTQRLKWRPKIHKQICWQELETASRKTKRHTYLTITKIASGHIAVAHKLKQRGERKDAKCSYCGEKETVNHMFQCKHNIAQQQRIKAIQNIKETLNKTKTKQSIKREIIQGIQDWMNKEQQTIKGQKMIKNKQK